MWEMCRNRCLPACLPGLWENCILKMNSKGFFYSTAQKKGREKGKENASAGRDSLRRPHAETWA